MYWHVCLCICVIMCAWLGLFWFMYYMYHVCICMYLNVYAHIHMYMCVCLDRKGWHDLLPAWGSLGCFHDNVWLEPGSWLVVGITPVFDKKNATRTKFLTEDEPNGAARWRIETTYQDEMKHSYAEYQNPSVGPWSLAPNAHFAESPLLRPATGWHLLLQQRSVVQAVSLSQRSCMSQIWAEFPPSIRTCRRPRWIVQLTDCWIVRQVFTCGSNLNFKTGPNDIFRILRIHTVVDPSLKF
jgi:hypothetical protein